MQWHNIPAELRALPQWVVSASYEDKAPRTPRTGNLASSTNPKDWGTFEEACASGYKHIGFVFAESDPFAVIDLDNKEKDPATPEQLARHEKILESFQSYTEKSVSGRGYHILVRGQIPAGVNRDKVEVYSSGRYMICTGDVIRQAPIADYNQLLQTLASEMKPPTIELEEVDELLEDHELVEMADSAVNGEKFRDLCNGKWAELGYPSQSEADFALMSMLCFYTRSNEQARRIFRMSALGKREKAVRNDKYLDFALEKIRANQPVHIDFSGLALAQAPAQPVVAPANGVMPHALPTPVPVTAPPAPPPAAPAVPGIELPPGLVGEIAQYFYQSSIRPVPDIALVGAIGLIAGVVGRSYNISGMGLNQYLILIAKTGAGKESISTCIDSMVAAVRPSIPMVDQFIGPSAFASGQALIKILDKKPCFVSVLGEFGLTLQQLCDSNAISAQIMLRKVLLDLWSKSGWNKMLQSSVYSDAEKNTQIIQSPNVTILGESTPETFFEGLDASHIADGLIPRFSVVQYLGHRPPRNKNAGHPPDEGLTRRFADMVAVALTTSNNRSCMGVATDPVAQKILDEFDLTCDAEMNSGGSDVELQVWNRAHLKALKLSALLAVGVNPHQPCVTEDLANWAIKFVCKDVHTMIDRFKSGDVGKGDSKLNSDLQHVIEVFYRSPFDKVEKYGVNLGMFKDKVIPYCYLVRKTASLAAFRADKRGSTSALKSAIEEMLDANMLAEVPSVRIMSRFGMKGRAFVVGDAWKIK